MQTIHAAQGTRFETFFTPQEMAAVLEELLRVRCDGTTQTLILTAMGPGGATKANTSIREQTNP